jgi:hypothetical protein
MAVAVRADLTVKPSLGHSTNGRLRELNVRTDLAVSTSLGHFIDEIK